MAKGETIKKIFDEIKKVDEEIEKLKKKPEEEERPAMVLEEKLPEKEMRVENISGMFKAEPNVPTHIPRNFKEQIVLYKSGSDYNLYFYIEDAWKKFTPAGITKTIWYPAEAIRAPGVKPASYVDHGMSGAWEFTDGAEEQIVLNLKIPEDCDVSKDVGVVIGWSSPAQNQQCDWEVKYIVTKLNEDTSNSTPQETLQSYETSSSTANGFVISTFTISANQIDNDDLCFHFTIARDGDDAQDTLGDVAHIHGICFQYTTKI